MPRLASGYPNQNVLRLPSVSRAVLLLSLACALSLLGACSPAGETKAVPTAVPATGLPTEAAQPEPGANPAEPAAAPTPDFPPVEGPDPSYRVGIFYYPWYGTPDDYGAWVHWDQASNTPPERIGSDYYPVLGAYSSLDPQVVTQHFAWLREAGVGVIITSWWGQGTREDRALPVLLEQAERYGIKVAFHIEPYGGRSARKLSADVSYLYQQYGDSPAFFRSTAASRWSPDDRSKGLFFVWAIGAPDTMSSPVEASYWREAVDAIHALPDGALVIANTTETSWVDGGHFDGLYNYASLSTTGEGEFNWAQGLPPEAWYVPSVLPGFSARRIGYSESSYVDRLGGETYDNQWSAALGVGIEPAMVTITSFNEWHEGTQIEPAAPQPQDSLYTDYGALQPEDYLAATRRWMGEFLGRVWPEAVAARLWIQTASDWTTFGLIDGGRWIRPVLDSASPEGSYAWMEGDRFALQQPLARAQAGNVVEMVVDLQLSGLEPGGTLTFEIERGHIGWTQVEVMCYVGGETELVDTLKWFAISSGARNTVQFDIPVDAFLP